MSVKVKICGVRTPAILEVAAEAGADYVGFVIFPPSPRYLPPESAGELRAAAAGRIKTVAVLVDPDDALLDRVLELVAPDVIQLHGGETPERTAAIKQRSGRPVLKAIAIGGPQDAPKARDYRGAADLILFDAKANASARLPGGNGVAFDWSLLLDADIEAPYALSGGLTCDTVGEAIARTGAYLVDVSSGVERSPGEKDPALVRRFIETAKSARTQAEAKA